MSAQKTEYTVDGCEVITIEGALYKGTLRCQSEADANVAQAVLAAGYYDDDVADMYSAEWVY